MLANRKPIFSFFQFRITSVRVCAHVCDGYFLFFVLSFYDLNVFSNFLSERERVIVRERERARACVVVQVRCASAFDRKSQDHECKEVKRSYFFLSLDPNISSIDSIFEKNFSQVSPTKINIGALSRARPGITARSEREFV